jgi:hypothetical protein
MAEVGLLPFSYGTGSGPQESYIGSRRNRCVKCNPSQARKAGLARSQSVRQNASGVCAPLAPVAVVGRKSLFFYKVQAFRSRARTNAGDADAPNSLTGLAQNIYPV